MKYEHLKDIIIQLEKCEFTDNQGHHIENNVAFIALKERVKCDNCGISNTDTYYCDSCIDNAYESSPNS